MKRLLILAYVPLFAWTVLSAQTRITPPANPYPPSQDVELGRQAAAQVEQELPIMHDDEVTSYVQDVGARLAGAIPLDLNYSEFHYTFKVVDVKDDTIRVSKIEMPNPSK